MNEFRSQQSTGQQSLQNRGIGAGPPRATPSAPPPAVHKAEETGSLGLIGDPEGGGESKIKSLAGGGPSIRKENYTRKVFTNGTGICRMRSFHGRLSSQGLEYMDNQINEWLDSNPDVEVKFVTSTVGIFEGKMREPALILNIWY